MDTICNKCRIINKWENKDCSINGAWKIDYVCGKTQSWIPFLHHRWVKTLQVKKTKTKKNTLNFYKKIQVFMTLCIERFLRLYTKTLNCIRKTKDKILLHHINKNLSAKTK